MSQAHPELKAMAPGYVLGALDPDERRVFEAHLNECAECVAEVRSLMAAMEALAGSVAQRMPPADLRHRVMSSIRGATWLPIQRGAAAPSPWGDRRIWLPMTALVLIALGAGIYGSHLHVETRLAALSERAEASDREIAAARRAAAEARSVMEIIAAPDVVRIDLQGQGTAANATARALWSRQHGLVFAGTNIPTPPSGRRYQVWVVTTGAVISAGILPEFGGGLLVLDTPPTIARLLGVTVTLEPERGSAGPTGPKVLVGSQPATY